MMRLTLDHLYIGLVFLLAGVVILLGGSSYQNVPFDLIMRLLSVPVLCWSLYKLAIAKIDARSGFVLVLLAIIAILIASQLYVVPIDVWKSLPNRAIWENDLNALGISNASRALSLDPDATLEALFQFLPISATGLAALCLNGKQRYWMVATFLGFGFLSVAFGAFQYASATPTLFDYTSASISGGKTWGFFTNRNHWAIFLVSMIPLAGTIVTTLPRRLGWPEIAILVAGLLVIVAGVGVSGSRAGFGLMFVALILTTFVWLVPKIRARSTYLTLLIGSLVGSVILAFVFFNNGFRAIARFSEMEQKDGRIDIWDVTMRAAEKYLPWGSGGGSFVNVYKAEETVRELSPGYANQAHNEYLQILLEYGWPGLLVLGFASIGLMVCFISWAWSRQDQGPSVAAIKVQAYYFIIILVLAALHSIVDYPLRAPSFALIVTFVFVAIATPYLNQFGATRILQAKEP